MKQIGMLLMMVMLLLSTFAAVSAQTASTSQIQMSLVNQVPDPVEPGTTVDVRLRIENAGGAIAPNVEVRIPDRYPFTTVDPSNGVKQVGSIRGLQTGDVGVIARFTLNVASNAAAGDAVIAPEYRINGGPWTQGGEFTINVRSEDATLFVEEVQLTPIALVPGQEGKVTILLHNLAGVPLKDVRVKLDLGSSDPFTPIGSTNQKIIQTIVAGDTMPVSFSLVPDAEATAKIYKVGLSLNYKDDAGNTFSSNNTIGLPVDKEPEYIIALEDTDVYTANSNGNVVLSISNIGPTNIKYLTVSLKDADGYQVTSAPSVYVGNLESDDFETAEFDIHTTKGAQGTVPLELELRYKDDFNKDFVVTQAVPLKIYSGSDAGRLGLATANGSPMALFFTLSIQVILGVFVIFMLVDVAKNPMPRYKKVLWVVLILTGIGAAIYYFTARRKQR